MFVFIFHSLVYLAWGSFLILRVNSFNPLCFSFFVFSFYGIIAILMPIIRINTEIISYDFYSIMIFALFSLIVSLHFIKPKIQNSIRPLKYVFFKTHSNRILFIYLIILSFEILFLLYDQGLLTLLTKNRSDARLQRYYDVASIFDFLERFSTPLILLVMGAQKQKNHKLIILTLIAISFKNLLIAEHRTTVVLPIILTMFYVHYYVKKLKLKVILVGAFCILIFFSFFQYARKGMLLDIRENPIEYISLKHGASGLGTLSSFIHLYNTIQNGYTKIEYGKQLWYYNIIMLIPRFLWTDKPTVSFSARMTEHLYGKIGFGKKSWVRTYTVWGEGYSQFGILGVMLYSALTVAIVRYLFLFLSKYEGTHFISFYYLANLPLLMRADLFSFYSRAITLCIFFFIAHFILYSSNKSQKDNSIIRELSS